MIDSEFVLTTNPEAPHMWERFTEHAKQTVSTAREEALRRGSTRVDTEHILLGICHESESVAATVLVNLGADLQLIIREIDKQTAKGDSVESTSLLKDEVVFTPRAKRVLELAVEQARRVHAGYIGSQHILLGVIMENDGVGAKTLQSLRLEPDQIRGEMTRVDAERYPHKRHPTRMKRIREHQHVIHAKFAIAAACEEAANHGSEKVLPIHMLLGLCLAPDSAPAYALVNLGVRLDVLAEAINHHLQTAKPNAPTESASGTRPKTVMELAIDEARQRNHAEVRSEHLVYALAKRRDSTTVELLQRHNIDFDAFQREVERIVEIDHD